MIKFGPSGSSIAFIEAGFSKIEQSATWVKKLGLNIYEYSFGRGVNLSDERAMSAREAFEKESVEITVHAPYYINFANPSEEMAEKSINYVIDSAKKCKLMGGRRVIFHPASQGKLNRNEAVELTKKRLAKLRDRIYREGLDDMLFCPETMGKSAQIGTIEEVVDFCKIDKIFLPCIDFGHVNARENGSLKTEYDYLARLEYMIDNLGFERIKNFHVHFSKIEYTLKGEVKHLTFEDDIYGPEFPPLAKALKKLGLEPYILSESAGTQDIDALSMQKIYFSN